VLPDFTHKNAGNQKDSKRTETGREREIQLFRYIHRAHGPCSNAQKKPADKNAYTDRQ
jgi:hypothetical protein